MFERIFLAAVGVLYLALAAYCALLPVQASRTVGLEMKGGSGRSEFLTVYGGLELGLALIFLIPALRDQYVRPALLACILIHASLVVSRSASFMLYDGISTSTYKLAGGEWIILLASLAVLWKNTP